MSVRDQMEQVISKVAELLTGETPGTKAEYQFRTRITNADSDPVPVDGNLIINDPTDGDTIVEIGTVGTTPIDVPSVAGGVLTQVLIEVPQTNPPSVTVSVSFDGGTTFKEMAQGSSFAWSPRGGITQLKVKSSAAGTAYEIVLNRDDP